MKQSIITALVKFRQVFFFTLCASFAGVTASAATYTVTNINDSGPGSLRAVISAANTTSETDMIVFNISGCPSGVCRIILTSGRLGITSAIPSGGLTITNHSGAAKLIISGNNASGIFYTSGSNPITLDGLTLENGGGEGHYGGAIYNDGNLTVSNSVIRNNRAEFGAGIFNRGIAVTADYGSLVVISCEITGNVANSSGGGILSDDMSHVVIRDSLIADNSAAWGGGLGLSSFYYGPWAASIINSTISRNTSGYGGAVDAYGGYGDLRITNSTVTMNSGPALNLYLANLLARNSIIAGNTSADIYIELGSFIDLGDNLVGGLPRLGPLANNGGPTRTHALLSGSPAINSGNNCVLTANGCGDGNPAVPSDQRGIARVDTVDIGAFELNSAAAGYRSSFDLDGDGRSDISVFRPSDSVWYLNRSTQGFSATQFGLPTDKIAPADYDGDGKTDIAVFRDGTWWIQRSTDSTVETFSFGFSGDIPVPADYTGDGRDELAVYRNGQWWALDLSNGQSSLINFGLATDKPVPADYDGDGRVDQAVYRDGEWRLNRSNLGPIVITFGLSTDTPVVGDYDGDGRHDIAVYRDGTWYLRQSIAGLSTFQWGLSTDNPAPADYDGDGKTDAAVFRDGTWYQRHSTGGTSIQQFGLSGDKPLAASFIE